MNVISKPIEVISFFDKKGIPTPMKFKYKNDDESITKIKVDKVILKELQKDHFVPKQHCFIFKCQSVIEDVLRLYELKFVLETCKWFLYKI